MYTFHWISVTEDLWVATRISLSYVYNQFLNRPFRFSVCKWSGWLAHSWQAPLAVYNKSADSRTWQPTHYADIYKINNIINIWAHSFDVCGQIYNLKCNLSTYHAKLLSKPCRPLSSDEHLDWICPGCSETTDKLLLIPWFSKLTN